MYSSTNHTSEREQARSYSRKLVPSCGARVRVRVRGGGRRAEGEIARRARLDKNIGIHGRLARTSVDRSSASCNIAPWWQRSALCRRRARLWREVRVTTTHGDPLWAPRSILEDGLRRSAGLRAEMIDVERAGRRRKMRFELSPLGAHCGSLKSVRRRRTLRLPRRTCNVRAVGEGAI